MTTRKSPDPDEDDAQSRSLLSDVKLDDRQVRALRVAVIVMGVLIVMGLVALIGRIVYLITRPSGPNALPASGTVAPEVTATLPAGAQVRNLSLQGDRLAIHYDTPAGAGITIVDLASGRTLSRVQLVPGVPRP